MDDHRSAELTRARGRSDPKLWHQAAGEWEAISRPYPAAIARWRAAEAMVEAGERAGATDAARAALESARHMGSRWLSEELEVLAERGRLELEMDVRPVVGEGPEADLDPFGLTRGSARCWR